jgi:UDP-N-acetylglucosamine 1-carboxyvinyltransferase
MSVEYLEINQVGAPLQGTAQVIGAKNAVLVIMASLVLTNGKSRLFNVPNSADVWQMIKLLEQLGAQVTFWPEEHMLEVNTTTINKWQVSPEIMKKMRASILVMGPLLARFGYADIAMPGGCVIGDRPIDYHLKNFVKMGVSIEIDGDFLRAQARVLKPSKLVLEYPSVGATENLLMAAVLTKGTTRILNAALEPEVLDLVSVLRKMGAHIDIAPPATIVVEGVEDLYSIEHAIISDRLETGALLLAVAATGGHIHIPQAPAHAMDIFLLKLEEMGHRIEVGPNELGVNLQATKSPRAVSFKTGPYPGFPTDLQAPMMALQCIAEGKSVIQETVFENRLVHTDELKKMGAQISVRHDTATITGVEALYGTQVIATDIRASCALVIAGLVAKGTTTMTGIHHWKRGYDALEKKLASLGAAMVLRVIEEAEQTVYTSESEDLLKQVRP